jgi:hypothetical protein
MHRFSMIIVLALGIFLGSVAGFSTQRSKAEVPAPSSSVRYQICPAGPAAVWLVDTYTSDTWWRGENTKWDYSGNAVKDAPAK